MITMVEVATLFELHFFRTNL